MESEKCFMCSKNIDLKKGMPQNRGRLFCSKECKSDYSQKFKTKYINMEKEKKSICQFCGEEFNFSKFKKFCSKGCRWNYKIKNITWGMFGNQPREKLIKIRSHLHQPLIREYYFERANFQCQQCGAIREDKALEIHHILPLYKGGNNDPDNLIVLCKKCHQKKHKIM